MPRKKYTAEQIIGMLREAEILLADGDTIATASCKLWIAGLIPLRLVCYCGSGTTL